MTQKKAPRLVKLQFIVFGVLLLIFFIWANRKCSRSQAESLAAQVLEEYAQAQADSLAAQTAAAPVQQAPPGESSVNRDTVRGGQMQIIRDKVTPLYVNIDNLALRKGPGLKYEIIDRFSLFDEVSFLNEVTHELDTIKLGTVTAAEPWVKVRNRKGREGWVYGAGVDYYKHKFEGID